MTSVLKEHWPEYLIEAGGLGVFMLAAGLMGTLLEYPGSTVHQAIPSTFARRALMGLAMGITAVGIIYSRWGKRSGAHINPAVTLTFFRLGKIRSLDAAFYIAAQFAGGLLGILLAAAILSSRLADDHVRYVATVPGSSGGAAFLAEFLMTLLLMTVVLRAGNHVRWHRFTGLLAGTLVAVYITFEAPVSGMSLNPARTFASALPGRVWEQAWVFFTAPFLGMLLAGEIHRNGRRRVACAKLHHMNDERCIFRCRFRELAERSLADSGAGSRTPTALPEANPL